MKKSLAAVIAAVLCICLSAAVFAEFDLSGLSVNELNELIAAAQKEILDRGGDVVIPNMKFADESLMVATYLIRDVEGNVFENGNMDYGSWTHLTLKDGQKLELQSPCYVRKGTRLGF